MKYHCLQLSYFLFSQFNHCLYLDLPFTLIAQNFNFYDGLVPALPNLESPNNPEQIFNLQENRQFISLMQMYRNPWNPSTSKQSCDFEESVLSSSTQNFLISFQKSTSKQTFLSLDDVRPFDKVAIRKRTRRGKQRRMSVTLTNFTDFMLKISWKWEKNIYKSN